MKYYKYIVIFLSILVLLLGGYIIYMKSTISLLDNDINNNNSSIDSGNNNIDSNNKVLDYDCSFTRTYRVVDLLDGYIAEVPEESYIVLDAFQTHSAFTHKISSEAKKNLEVNKYYEFTYYLKGRGIINDIEDVRNSISALNSIKSDNSLKVLLEVKETNKEGLEQVQENICEGK